MPDSMVLKGAPKYNSWLCQRQYVKDKMGVDKQAQLMASVYCADPKYRRNFDVGSSARGTIFSRVSPNQTMVASLHSDHSISVCNVETGKRILSLHGHNRTPWSLAWHNVDNELLAAGDLSGNVIVYHIAPNQAGYTINRWVARPGASQEKLTIFSLKFCGDMLLFTCQNVLHFWDYKGVIKQSGNDNVMSKILFKNRTDTFQKVDHAVNDDVGNIERVVMSSTNSRRIKFMHFDSKYLYVGIQHQVIYPCFIFRQALRDSVFKIVNKVPMLVTSNFKTDKKSFLNHHNKKQLETEVEQRFQHLFKKGVVLKRDDMIRCFNCQQILPSTNMYWFLSSQKSANCTAQQLLSCNRLRPPTLMSGPIDDEDVEPYRSIPNCLFKRKVGRGVLGERFLNRRKSAKKSRRHQFKHVEVDPLLAQREKDRISYENTLMDSLENGYNRHSISRVRNDHRDFDDIFMRDTCNYARPSVAVCVKCSCVLSDCLWRIKQYGITINEMAAKIANDPKFKANASTFLRTINELVGFNYNPVSGYIFAGDISYAVALNTEMMYGNISAPLEEVSVDVKIVRYGVEDEMCIVEDNPNVLTDCAVITNELSVDFSSDATKCVFIEKTSALSMHLFICVVASLRKCDYATRLHEIEVHNDIVSVSLSPCNNLLLLGFGRECDSLIPIAGSVYELKNRGNRLNVHEEASYEYVNHIAHETDIAVNEDPSTNAIQWMPAIGQGILLSTCLGSLIHITPYPHKNQKPANSPAT